MTLKISVIIPLLDHRNHALECLQSWAQQQTLERSNYQIVVVSDGKDQKLDMQIKAMLVPHDTFIVATEGNEFAFYNLGAVQAKGDLLLITESHCLGMPECLSEAIRFLTAHTYAGACCGSVNSTENRFAYMEDRMVDEVLTPRLENEHWHRVTVRGLVMWRHIFQAVGGFEAAHGHFAETALAARLHTLGHRLGYARQAVVYHYNTTSLAELGYLAAEYTIGECEYRLKYPVAYCESYFGHAAEWGKRESYRPATAWYLSRTLLKSLLRGVTLGDPVAMRMVQVKLLLHYGPIAMVGTSWPLWQARLALWLAQLRTSLWYVNQERAFQAYSEFWQGIVRYSRLKFIHRHGASHPPAWPEGFEYEVVNIDDSRLTGFFSLESWQGQTFRWSGPVALVQVTVPAGAYLVRLELLPIGLQERPLHIRLYFNGHQISDASLKMCDTTLWFRLNPAMFTPVGQHQQLVLICNPLQTGSLETRQLGLPVKGICFAADDSNLSD